MYKKYRCYFCNKKTKFKKTDVTNGIHSINKCLECNSLYSKLVPTKYGLKKLYTSDHYNLGKSSISSISKNFITNTIVGKLRIFFVLHKFYRRISFLKKKSVIIDFGCGDGSLALFLKKKFENVYTFDEYTSKPLYSKNITHYNSFFDLEKSKIKFDLIILKQVIEHVENPRSYLKKISKFLKKGGIILLETPNFKNNFYFDFFKEYYAQTTLGYHINFFCNSSITKIFKDNFKVYKFYKSELPILGLSIQNMLLKKIYNGYYSWLNLFFFPLQIILSYITGTNTNITILLKKNK